MLGNKSSFGGLHTQGMFVCVCTRMHLAEQVGVEFRTIPVACAFPVQSAFCIAIARMHAQHEHESAARACRPKGIQAARRAHEPQERARMLPRLELLNQGASQNERWAGMLPRLQLPGAEPLSQPMLQPLTCITTSRQVGHDQHEASYLPAGAIAGSLGRSL
jgi:hypothetical protein